MNHFSFRNLMLSFVVLMLFQTPGQAQRFEGGLTAGINMSQLDGDLMAGYNQIGLSGGIRASAMLAEKWRLGIELLYSQLGSDRARNDFYSLYDNIRLNFVEAPVLLSFTDWKFRIYTGASYSRLINYKVISSLGEDITDQQNYNPDMFSLIFGASFHFTEKIAADVRWSRHLNSLQADRGDGRILGRQIGIRLLYIL